MDQYKGYRGESFIDGDLNIHIQIYNGGNERVHGGCRFQNRYDESSVIVEFAKVDDIVIANIFFKKWDEHSIKFNSGMNISQIDCFHIQKS